MHSNSLTDKPHPSLALNMHRRASQVVIDSYASFEEGEFGLLEVQGGGKGTSKENGSLEKKEAISLNDGRRIP